MGSVPSFRREQSSAVAFASGPNPHLPGWRAAGVFDFVSARASSWILSEIRESFHPSFFHATQRPATAEVITADLEWTDFFGMHAKKLAPFSRQKSQKSPGGAQKKSELGRALGGRGTLFRDMAEKRADRAHSASVPTVCGDRFQNALSRFHGGQSRVAVDDGRLFVEDTVDETGQFGRQRSWPSRRRADRPASTRRKSCASTARY